MTLGIEMTLKKRWIPLVGILMGEMRKPRIGFSAGVLTDYLYSVHNFEQSLPSSTTVFILNKNPYFIQKRQHYRSLHLHPPWTPTLPFSILSK